MFLNHHKLVTLVNRDQLEKQFNFYKLILKQILD